MLYASTYQRRRSQCCMNGGGPGSGIWKSTDGGDTWTRLDGRLADRLARAASASTSIASSANIVYALDRSAKGRCARARRRATRRRWRRRAARRGGGGGRGGGWRRTRRWRRRDSDRPLSLRRRRRDVAEGEPTQPAPDVLQPDPHRSEQPRSHLHGRRRPARSRSTAAGPSRPTRRSVDPRRHARDLDRIRRTPIT